MKHKLKKFLITDYHQIIEELDLEDKEYDLIKNTHSDAETLSMLVKYKRYSSAIKYLALGLPKREAIWWGYLCCNHFESDQENNAGLLGTQNALSTISKWVHSPSEDLRIRTKSLADNLSKYTAIHWACLSVFWSGGSIAPIDQAKVEAAKYMANHAVSNAIYLCATKTKDQDKTFSEYLKIGLHIVMGGNGKIT